MASALAEGSRARLLLVPFPPLNLTDWFVKVVKVSRHRNFIS